MGGVVTPLPRVVTADVHLDGHFVPKGVGPTPIPFGSYSNLVLFRPPFRLVTPFCIAILTSSPIRSLSNRNDGFNLIRVYWKTILYPSPEVQGCVSVSSEQSTIPPGQELIFLCSLAWCELYLLFANLFRKLDMEIYETE